MPFHSLIFSSFSLLKGLNLVAFRSAFKYRRCIIPASGFYEWKTQNRIKHPWYINLKTGDPLAFAGLWETWQPEDGAPVESCCIITTTANSLMDGLHDRMPVILDVGQWEAWLSPQERQTDKLLSMIRLYNAEDMQAWPVSRELNRVGLRDDAGLIEPIPLLI
ncbi:SOS response-associated peptidase [Candidatus Nitrotoga sp. M5]|uniref:SOS response-associated peptidase n=1 Tax=Candidatus Nitrotoga sp. M5 TaxID=2890409 RepID=UPI001EF57DF6|nr:SOS response-associated peptidase [Candidatus Nitrotoga sp. M5]